MELPDVLPGRMVCHDVSGSLRELLGEALSDRPIAVALGPMYQEDPGAPLLAPFVRSARQSGWSSGSLAPPHVIEAVRAVRTSAAKAALTPESTELMDEWARAGLVLEIAGRRGVVVKGWGTLNVRWRLNGTVTGRFGAETLRGPGWNFNPLTIGRDLRWRVTPSGPDRRLVSIDFKAMDVWSMLSVVPGLARRYIGVEDPHLRTAELLFGREPSDWERALAKAEVWVHAYGGHSRIRELFERNIPEIGWLRSLPHGEGARLVQRTSAIAFRAGLAAALPLLVYDEVRPMLAVHDELLLDVLCRHETRAEEVAKALEAGALRRIGQPYRTGMKWGDNYAECKGDAQPVTR